MFEGGGAVPALGGRSQDSVLSVLSQIAVIPSALQGAYLCLSTSGITGSHNYRAIALEPGRRSVPLILTPLL